MKLINLAKINFAGESGSAPVPPGPTPAPSADADVVLRDYDGSVVASYTAEEFAALTELPTPSAHEGLTFQGWNWPLADAQAYCAQYGMVDIGATYITSDGKTRIYITLTEGRTTPMLGLGINGSVDVDWGDGSAHDTMTGSSLSTVNQQHAYSQPGDYIITIDVAENSEFTCFGDNDKGSYLLWDGSDNTLRTYHNAVKSVEFGVGVTTINSNAFYKCTSLTSISIPQGVTTLGLRAFCGCTSLTSISLPQSVTTIGNSVFQNCTSLTSISLPQSVTTIGNLVFQSCSILTRICIPQGVTTLSLYSLNYCTSLTSISIPQSVTTIDYSFRYCYSLTSISIPQGVTTISANAFQDCISMAIYRFFATTPPTIQSNTFSSIPSDCIIYVPAESVEAYKNANYWRNQASKIQPMP